MAMQAPGSVVIPRTKRRDEPFVDHPLRQESTSIGRKNTHERLRTTFGTEAGLLVQSGSPSESVSKGREMGYRYRMHARYLPGNPDLVSRPRKKVIFVRGCFWDRHGCRQYRQPRTKRSVWRPRLVRNTARDTEVKRELRKLGWGVMVARA
jgi:DNA mismatch endonuclease Vsr